MFILGNLQEVVDIFTDGGTVMAALAIVAFLLYTTATASLYFVFRGNLNHKQKSQWADWINDPDSAEGRVGEIIRYAIHGKKLSIKRVQRRFDEMREILIASIDRRLIIITTLVAAAPMTGLLGTVGGMLDMFDGLAAGGGKQSMGLIASGMKKALFTTLTGLVIALPGMFMSLMVRERRNKIDTTLAQLQSIIVTTKFRNV
ncbi:MotA/TolQ/ExbB proton channel family protein [Akkermansiaceae bacterium]|nr:MotA/TolQ/ExbB proton channel family protein [bacterium]MDA7891263.1 MotA/TolQ/ExbB proton channel family protein [Akkermansiaceae bacterium]MDA7896620.1 MotA/TolQ/ExbB proton channel family protein [bacterium]MDA7907432.1 MotA/TolQ/ExbB proton channel family protein [Akkermansiaceae bacterium]MDA9829800.1 MotA/TolQ/ExbB proton channel family protein [Akkermansiaceae bacterium]